jgi:hypothetical protein
VYNEAKYRSRWAQGNSSMTDDGRPPEIANAPDAALYIASLAEELVRLAKRHDLDALAYILDMARLEADEVSKRRPAPRPR